MLTDRTIATFTNVRSGSTVEAKWRDLSAGEHSWYVVTSDPYGAVDRSPVATFTVQEKVKPAKPAKDRPEAKRDRGGKPPLR